MRNFKIKKRTKPIFISKAAFVNVTLIAGITIFMALATVTGKLVSDNMLPTDSPVLNPQTPSPGATPNAPNDATSQSISIRLDAKDYYFVQFGVFSSLENARSCANSIVSKGGAGYVKEIEGKHYVYAMSYTQNDDAKTVVSQLKSQGYSTMLKRYSHSGLKVDLSGAPATLDSLKNALEGISQIPDELETIIFDIDKGNLKGESVTESLTQLKNKVNGYLDILKLYSEQSGIFSGAADYCTAVNADVEGVLELTDSASLSPSLKFVYINSIFELIEYLDNCVIE